MLTIQEGAGKVVKMCMGVKAGEKAVIITDLLRPASLGSALQKACMEQGAEAVLITIDSQLVDGQLPDSVGRAISYADVTKAQRELGWTARHSLEDMCRDAWNWQKNNPNGFE